MEIRYTCKKKGSNRILLGITITIFLLFSGIEKRKAKLYSKIMNTEVSYLILMRTIFDVLQKSEKKKRNLQCPFNSLFIQGNISSVSVIFSITLAVIVRQRYESLFDNGTNIYSTTVRIFIRQRYESLASIATRCRPLS